MLMANISRSRCHFRRPFGFATMAKTKHIPAASTESSGGLINHRIQISFVQAHVTDLEGYRDGIADTCHFRDSNKQPALNYEVAFNPTGTLIEWWSDGPFVLFPEFVRNWSPVPGSHRLLLHATGPTAGFGSVPEALGSSNQRLRLRVGGIQSELVGYRIFGGMEFPEAERSRPIRTAHGKLIATPIIRATIRLA